MPATVVLDPYGRPIKQQAADARCPRCRASADKRVGSCGFGMPSTLCGVCGFDFHMPWIDERTS